MIGSNVPAHPSRGGLATLFHYADEWGSECAQTYITLSRRWSVRDLRPEEISDFKSTWQKSKVKEVVAHVPLIVNLASPLDETWQKSTDRLSAELHRVNQLGIHFLVLHTGYYGDSGKKTGTERVIKGLKTVLDGVNESTGKILLETMAGQGTALGFRFEDIAHILNNVAKKNFLGVCLDTSHVFAAGYDLRGYQGYDRVLKEFDAAIGLDELKAIHLNDSKTELGSRVDRHAPIGEGKMGLQVFHAFVTDQRFRDTPMVLELPSRDADLIKRQLELLRKLQATTDPVSEPKEIREQSTLDSAFRT
jgi:deoxyribonuclease-4